MNAAKFFDSVTEEILQIILETPLIRNISQLNRAELQQFFVQFHYFVDAFPRYLGALVWQSPDDKIRLVLLDNLIDESGGFERIQSLNSADTHPALFRRVLHRLNISDQQLATFPPEDYTRQMLSELEKLFIHSPFLEAFGGIAPGVESIFYTWIEVVQKGLEAYSYFTQDDLLYFSLHAVVDHEHSNALKNAIMPYLNTEYNRKLLRRGALTMVYAQKHLFEGLTKQFEQAAV